MTARSRITNRNQSVARGDGRRRGQHYDRYHLGAIIKLFAAGHSKRFIAIELQIPRSSVQKILQNSDELDRVLGHREDLRQPIERATKITPEKKVELLESVRRNPKVTYRLLLLEHSLEIDEKTLKRFFRLHGIKGWMCKMRSHITARHAALRLAWCNEHKDWTHDQWKSVIFSDESTVQRGSGGRREYCLRTSAQKWDQNCLQTATKTGGISCMVWGAFSIDMGRSPLLLMKGRNPAGGPGNGINSARYTDALFWGLGMMYDNSPQDVVERAIFQQDNAAIHKSYETRRFFNRNSITVMDWPPYSPDLNPIEHVWVHLKTAIRRDHPELDNLPSGPNAVRRVAEAAVEAWEKVDWKIFESLAESMPRRIKACIDSDGWHTRY